jgi:UDP-glucose 4-epimerase
MKFLVTGGAGYIGSHLVKHLQLKNHEVTVVDNFSTGNKWAINDCEIYEIDLLDKFKLLSNFANRKFDGIFHLAAKSLVSESFRFPNLYYQNNVVATQNILDLMSKTSTEKIVFSSTAAIFGLPLEMKIKEQHQKNPINPYGSTKLQAEKILKNFSIKNNIKCISLRYFNAAGADPAGTIGEYHNPETHLIPRACNSIFSDCDVLEVFGNDYNTPDGTCIRDYVHVNDIVNAHFLAFANLDKNKFYDDFNLGNSIGFSVLDIIKTIEKLSGKKVNYKFVRERDNEPGHLVADNVKAIKELNWNIKYSNIDNIISSALLWHKNLLNKVHLN